MKKQTEKEFELRWSNWVEDPKFWKQDIKDFISRLENEINKNTRKQILGSYNKVNGKK